MNQAYAPSIERPVFELDVDARATFIARTYGHLFGAMIAFVGLEVAFFKTALAGKIYEAVAGNWMIALGGFMIFSWIASHVAARARSLPIQYLALAGFVLLEAIIFVPLLMYANVKAPGAIASAGVVTLGGFAGLTFIVFWTRKDFSFLGAIVKFGMFAALLAIGASMIFGFQMGTYFSVAMVVLACGAILWDTSNILHHYPEDRYVGAALGLFASVAMLFWYVLQLFLNSDE